MSLLINQGKQTVQANSYAPIEEKNVTMTIEKMEIDKYTPNSLRVQFRLLDGLHKNACVFDVISYDPNSKMAWKYQSLRAAANVPYDENEPAQIDIETLLLHRVVKADLAIRKYTKDGVEKEAQNISYKRPAKTTVSTPVAQTAPTVVAVPTQSDAASFEEISVDDDLPFSEAVVTEKQPIQTAEKTSSEEKADSAAPTYSNSVYDDWD